MNMPHQHDHVTGRNQSNNGDYNNVRAANTESENHGDDESSDDEWVEAVD